MRLTNTDREAFVLGILGSLKKVDYNEEMRSFVTALHKEILPKVVYDVYNSEHKEALNDHYLHVSDVVRKMKELDCEELADFSTRGSDTPGYYMSSLASYFSSKTLANYLMDNKEQLKKFMQMVLAFDEQRNKLNAIEQTLTTEIKQCQTLESAKKRFGEEYHEFLPKERDKTGTIDLPALQNVKDALKEFGFPEALAA